MAFTVWGSHPKDGMKKEIMAIMETFSIPRTSEACKGWEKVLWVPKS